MRSFDGKELYTYLWDDVDAPRGVVQLCHGMCEHLGRYDDFARYLNKNRFIVFGDDHRSYGKTDNNAGYCEGEYVGDTVKDLVFINDYLKKKYGLPIVFFGHSYGSVLGQRFVQLDTGIKCAVLTGTLLMPHALCRMGQGIMAPVKAIAPKAGVGLSSAKFPDESDDAPDSFLTKDLEIRRQYRDDPLCGGKSSLKYYYGFLKLMGDATKKANVKAIPDDLPVGIFSGADDGIGKFGKGPTTLYNTYRKYGKNAYLKLYENDRHEILNETDKDVVYADILSFINEHI